MIKMLDVSSLTKRYGQQTALDGIDLCLDPGERVALLGHNGAGKSTLMKLVLGLLARTDGVISVGGHEPGTQAAKELTTYLPENVAFHPSLTGREQIQHYLRLRGRPAGEADSLLEKVGLAQAARHRIGTYSKGMRQRIGLAQALIGNPSLMVLDEPTSGLDPISRGEFYALLDDLAAHGTAVLMSSHALSEIEARTDRIVILSNGRKVVEGSLGHLRSKAALPLNVQLRAQPGSETRVAAAFPEAQLDGDILTMPCPQSGKLDMLQRITAEKANIEDFDFLSPSLDDIYAQICESAA